MAQPTCYIIAGPNGAGKTTFALNFLPDFAHCRHFINADMIASGLSPFAPELIKVQAGRLFLKEMKHFIHQQESFGFETTLSGKSYLRLIQRLKQSGWRIELYYLWLPSIEFSAMRVEERVKHGGHNIPLADIQRRYPKSIGNLLTHYAPLCDLTVCMDNSSITPDTIFMQENLTRTVLNPIKFKQITGAL